MYMYVRARIRALAVSGSGPVNKTGVIYYSFDVYSRTLKPILFARIFLKLDRRAYLHIRLLEKIKRNLPC